MSLNIEKKYMGPHMQIRSWKLNNSRIKEDLFDNKHVKNFHVSIQEDWHEELKFYIKSSRKFKSLSEYIRYCIYKDQYA